MLTHNNTVALPRRQHEPPVQSSARRTNFTRPILRLDLRHRGRLLPVLHELESVQDTPGAAGDEHCGVPEWLESAHGGAGEKISGIEMSGLACGNWNGNVSTGFRTGRIYIKV